MKRSLILLLLLTFFKQSVATGAYFDSILPLTGERKIDLIDPYTKEVIHTFHPEDYWIELDVRIFKEEVENWIQEIQPKYFKEMTLDRIDTDGEIIKGTPKTEINASLLTEEVLKRAFTGGRIEIPLKVTESNYRPTDVLHLKEVVIATYTTRFNPNQTGRSKNIEISAAAIHNVIVGSGDKFSFNSIVGPREIANGYQMAPEIVNGKLVMGIGGGICQTSSTLFNAVDQLSVEIIERHHHSKDVGYVPKGRDATVSFYGGLDFQFINTTGVPFLIQTYYRPGSLTVVIRTSKEYAELMQNELAKNDEFP
jgi:vancomycin resistance protein YoaR